MWILFDSSFKGCPIIDYRRVPNFVVSPQYEDEGRAMRVATGESVAGQHTEPTDK